MLKHDRKLISTALLALLFSSSVWALDPKLAHRDPGVSYRVYQSRAREMVSPLVTPLAKTPMDESKKYSEAVLPKAQTWESLAFMQAHFETLRDRRWMTRRENPEFLRRSSWLYPDDGCFARASLAVMNALRDGATAPNKIFAFGDLRVQTANAPGGEVTWWYHVAPIVEVDGVKYVLDAAIDPQHPMTIDQWLGSMADEPGNLEVAICASGTYEPYDNCARVSDGVEATATTDQNLYLYYEWLRIRDLGREPESELGESPPWKDLTVF